MYARIATGTIKSCSQQSRLVKDHCKLNVNYFIYYMTNYQLYYYCYNKLTQQPSLCCPPTLHITFMNKGRGLILKCAVSRFLTNKPINKDSLLTVTVTIFILYFSHFLLYIFIHSGLFDHLPKAVSWQSKAYFNTNLSARERFNCFHNSLFTLKLFNP